MERTTLFCDILLPLPLKPVFTYRVPYEWNERVMPGIRAVVQFGKRKVYSGLIRRVHQTPPDGVHVKYILSLLDNQPIVREEQFSFWEWIADYYLCTVGEVMQAALPPALKLSGETQILLAPTADLSYEGLSEKENALIQTLIDNHKLDFSQAQKITGINNVYPLVKSLVERGILLLHDHLEDTAPASQDKMVRLTLRFSKEEALKTIFDSTEKKAPKQLEVLLRFVFLSGCFTAKQSEVFISELLKPIKGGRAALSALMKKGVLEEYLVDSSRFKHLAPDEKSIQLSPHQQEALEKIEESFATHGTTLLHGVTASGKTEIYAKLIAQQLALGKQVLYLLPEIALTTQIISRIQRNFGERAGVYHSRFSPAERAEVWNNLINGGISSHGKLITYDLVLGTRSALFLPFKNLGLIIVDEEHDQGYKQIDPAPRYQARDAAIYLAKISGAKILLGSATPSVETYFHAINKKYGFVELSQRHGGVLMPQIIAADLRSLTFQKQMKSHFSPLLLQSITQALQNKEQVILFQNRRGFSPRLECDQCNWVPGCKHCDVSLVYHKKLHRLKCHYCGYTVEPFAKCPDCQSPKIQLKGFGTEKIEEELPLFYPDAQIARLDTDTTQSKNAYGAIISKFEERKIDILVGTQMVSKGLDFANVGVVGILNADNMLSFPDFRAHEKAFQLMSQVSGRAGRSQKQGVVIIQTWNPANPTIQFVINHDYQAMFLTQLKQRQEFDYPPFVRLILIKLFHADAQILNKASSQLCQILKRKFPGKVLGPEYPIVPRVKNMYAKTLMVKINKGAGLANAKKIIVQSIADFQSTMEWKTVRVSVDVDPA